MIWANRATRRQPFPTGRFFSAPTGTSTASRRIKRFEKNMIEHEPQNDSMNFHSRIGLATLLAMLLSLSARAADWPQWRGPNRNNARNETAIPRTFRNKGWKSRWRTPVAPGGTSSVVVQGRVYLS